MRTNTLSENRKGGEDININPREKKKIPVYYIFYQRRPFFDFDQSDDSPAVTVKF